MTPKFKVWDKVKKEFPAYFFLISEEGTLYELVVKDFLNNDGESVAYDITERVDNDNYEIVFSTGLTDKSGKEIYEGDIYQGINGYNIFYKEIAYIDSGYCILGYQINTYLKDIEIIGNKFENPELLEQKE